MSQSYFMTKVRTRRLLYSSFVIFTLLLGTFSFSQSIVSAQTGPEKVKVLIGFKGPPELSVQSVKEMDENIRQVEAMAKSNGGKVSHNFHPFIDVIAVEIPVTALEGISHNPNVLYIEEDAIATTQGHTSSNTKYLNSWGVDHIDADIVAANNNKGAGVKVAVLDSGIDYTHPELDDNYLVGGLDHINNDSDPMDDYWHGTHVAGSVAAEKNGIGVVGTGPEISIYAVKVLDNSGFGYYSQIIAGIQWASNNADIASMSLGGKFDSTSLHNAVTQAYNNGLLIVAAAGNKGNTNGNGDNILFPAKYAEVIAVGATDENNVRASFSSTGNTLEIMAPGVDIRSTYPGSLYAFASGTSMATPHVSGVAALVMNSDETCWNSLGYTNGDGIWTNTEVRTVLVNTADDLGVSGKDSRYGYGLVDPVEAAQQCGGTLDTTPPTITPPADLTVQATTTTPPGQAVAIGTATATDSVDPNPAITNNAPALYQLGTTIVTWTATDASDNSASADQSVTVEDTIPPETTKSCHIYGIFSFWINAL